MNACILLELVQKSLSIKTKQNKAPSRTWGSGEAWATCLFSLCLWIHIFPSYCLTRLFRANTDTRRVNRTEFFLQCLPWSSLLCAGFLSSCRERGSALAATHGLLTAAASPVAERRLQAHGLRSCSTWAQELCFSGSGAQGWKLSCSSLVALWLTGSSQTRDRTDAPALQAGF